MLADLVKAGKLPPVEKRLPPNPVVVEPTNMIGKYGGTMYCTSMAPEVVGDIQLGMVTGLYQFNHDLSEMTPSVAERHEFSDDYTSCTIYLRKGIFWSDGEPFTADDMMFYFEDWQFDKDLCPTINSNWQPKSGSPMTVTKIDDYTVKFDFGVPYPSFPLIHYSGGPLTPWRPKHFMSKFHIKYNPNADEEAKAAGFNSWMDRFNKVQSMDYGAQDPDMPVLSPWRPVKSDSQGVEFERNPYYFKVDTEGNQLPYVDRVVMEYVSDLEVANMKAVSGELTVAGLDLLLSNYPVIKDGEQAGDYRTVMVYSERGSDGAIAFNQVHPDPVLREIFRDVRFRQAMSVAINRDEINELVFLGLGTPRQATINDTASFYKKEWGEAYAQYDVELANKLLDEMGLDKKGPDGIRLRPDGQPLAFQLEYVNQEGPKQDICELVVKHWAQVGVKAEAVMREKAYLTERLNAMEHDCSAWHVDRQLERIAWGNGWMGSKLGPGGNSMITWAKGWRDWLLSGGTRGVEPSQEAKDVEEVWNQWRASLIGTPEYMDAATRTHGLLAQNLWVIGTVGQTPQPVIVSNKVENVFPSEVFEGTQKVWWGAANYQWCAWRVEQWFLK